MQHIDKIKRPNMRRRPAFRGCVLSVPAIRDAAISARIVPHLFHSALPKVHTFYFYHSLSPQESRSWYSLVDCLPFHWIPVLVVSVRRQRAWKFQHTNTLSQPAASIMHFALFTWQNMFCLHQVSAGACKCPNWQGDLAYAWRQFHCKSSLSATGIAQCACLSFVLWCLIIRRCHG